MRLTHFITQFHLAGGMICVASNNKEIIGDHLLYTPEDLFLKTFLDIVGRFPIAPHIAYI